MYGAPSMLRAGNDKEIKISKAFLKKLAEAEASIPDYICCMKLEAKLIILTNG